MTHLTIHPIAGIPITLEDNLSPTLAVYRDEHGGRVALRSCEVITVQQFADTPHFWRGVMDSQSMKQHPTSGTTALGIPVLLEPTAT